MNAVSGCFPDGLYFPHPESIRNMAVEFADGREDGALDPQGGRAYSGGMNVEEKALSTFRTEPWRHNCAQAVCAALGREDLLEAVSACGTGRAPDGVCGALYGALLCTPVQSREELKRRFVEKLGYSHCRELKKEGCVPCRDCVASAAFMAFDLQE